MDFSSELKALKTLLRDSEKQLLEFNEIIPYDRNPSDIYSPKLVNLLLQIGPQIESLTDLIGGQLGLKLSENGLPSRINQLNSDGVLSNFDITTRPHNLKISPFENELQWWSSYNKTKHELAKFQFKVTYQTVMESLAALAALHRLASVCQTSNEENKKLILQKQYWNLSFNVVSLYPQSPSRPNFSEGPWASDLFKIAHYFVYMPGY